MNDADSFCEDDQFCDELIYEYLTLKKYQKTVNTLLAESPHLQSLSKSCQSGGRKRSTNIDRNIDMEIRRRIFAHFLSTDLFKSIISPVRKMQSALNELDQALRGFGNANNAVNVNRHDDNDAEKSIIDMKQRKNRIRKPQLVTQNIQRWNKIVDQHISYTFVPDTVARTINNQSGDLDVSDVLRKIENDPSMMSAFESVLIDYFSPKKKSESDALDFTQCKNMEKQPENDADFLVQLNDNKEVDQLFPQSTNFNNITTPEISFIVPSSKINDISCQNKNIEKLTQNGSQFYLDLNILSNASKNLDNFVMESGTSFVVKSTEKCEFGFSNLSYNTPEKSTENVNFTTQDDPGFSGNVYQSFTADRMNEKRAEALLETPLSQKRKMTENGHNESDKCKQSKTLCSSVAKKLLFAPKIENNGTLTALQQKPTINITPERIEAVLKKIHGKK